MEARVTHRTMGKEEARVERRPRQHFHRREDPARGETREVARPDLHEEPVGARSAMPERRARRRRSRRPHPAPGGSGPARAPGRAALADDAAHQVRQAESRRNASATGPAPSACANSTSRTKPRTREATEPKPTRRKEQISDMLIRAYGSSHELRQFPPPCGRARGGVVRPGERLLIVRSSLSRAGTGIHRLRLVLSRWRSALTFRPPPQSLPARGREEARYPLARAIASRFCSRLMPPI